MLSLSSYRFLHAYLQVQALEGCTTVREARAAVNAFPHTIEAMYRLSVRRIKEQKRPQAALALRILQWLTYANEGLTVEDLQYALAASVDTENYQYDDDNVPCENSIVSVCCGLVTIQPESRQVRLVREWLYDLDRLHFCLPQARLFGAGCPSCDVARTAPIQSQPSFLDRIGLHWTA